MAQSPKGFWLKLYPIDPATGTTVEVLFTSVNRATACYIEGDSKEYKPYLEGYPVFGIKVFDGEFDGKAEVTLDQIEVSANNTYVPGLNAYVWDGVDASLYKGNASDTSFASLTEIWSGVVEKAPDIDEDKAKFTFGDLSYRFEKPFLTAKYAGTGGLEGPVEATGAFKPVIFGSPLSVEPVLINAAYVIFQYDGGLGYQRCSALAGVYENGLSFGAATATVAWQGSAAATYTALQNAVLTVGQWADAPSIGCFRLGGEPKSNGVVCCDPVCNTLYIDQVLQAVILQAVTSGVAGLDSTNMSTFRTATGNQTINDYILEQSDCSELIYQYLSEVGGYGMWSQAGAYRFGLIRFNTPTITIDSQTGPYVVTEMASQPISAPTKRLRIGADKCFRVHSTNEISDALLSQVNTLQASLTTLQNSVYSAASDGVLTAQEKNQITIPANSTLENEYTRVKGRADALGLTYATLTSARSSYISARDGMSPAWNNVSADTNISGITSPTFRNRVVTYADEIKKLDVLISQKDAQMADWPQVSGTGRPADNADVTGSNTAVGDANRVRYSRMERGIIGWDKKFNPNSLVYTTEAIDLTTSTDSVSLRTFHAATTFTAANQQISFGSTGFSFAETKIPVTPGERIFAGMRIKFQAPSALYTYQIVVQYMDAAGSPLGAVTIASDADNFVSFGTRVGAFFTVPALASSAYLEFYARSNAAVTFGTVDICIAEPMLCGAGSLQTVWPTFNIGPSGESGADVTASVVGPATGTVTYDNGNTTFQDADDLTYKAQNALGTIATGVTATYKIVGGTVNGLTSASGAQTLTLTSGGGSINVTSMTTDTATIEVTFVSSGKTLPTFKTVLTKKLAAASGAGGGSGGGSTNSQTSGYTSLSTTGSTFSQISSTLTTGSVPSGKTTCKVDLSLTPKAPKTQLSGGGNAGPWNIQYKVRRNVSGTRSDLTMSPAAPYNSNPDPYIDADGDGFIISSGGSMVQSATFAVTVGQTYDVEIWAVISSGTFNASYPITHTGTITLTLQ